MPTYDDIKKQVERRYRRLAWFVFHLILALTVLGGIWVLAPSVGVTTLMFAAVWIGALIFHGFMVWLGNMRDLDIERTWAKYAGERNPDDIYEKPKRLLRLSDEDDTELEIIEEAGTKAKRSR